MAEGDVITITQAQLDRMIEISKDVQERVKANGMPELDEDIAEMIRLMEEAQPLVPPPGEEIIPEKAKRR
jgi:hypothetical protein